MKKILLYLLLACSISTFAQAEFPEGIKLGGNASTVNSTKLLNQNPTTGTLDYINATSLPVSTATANALALKADISSVHNPVTIGTANGLSLSTQQLSLGLASSGVTGALSGTDWTTFNGKFNTPSGLTTNYLPKWNGSSFGNTNWQEIGGRLTNGSDNLVDALQVNGSGYFSGDLKVVNEIFINSSVNSNLFFKKGTENKWILGYADNINAFRFTNGVSDVFKLNNNGTVDFSSTITASPAVLPNQVPVLSQVATLTGNQTIAGTKTFSAPVIIPNGVNPNEGVNKGQLDAVVGTSGTFTVAGIQNATYMLVGKILTIYLSASFTGVSGGFIQGSTFTLPNGYISADFLAGRFVGNGSCFNGTSAPLTAWAEEMSNTSLRYNISGTGAVNHKSFITISLRIQ